MRRRYVVVGNVGQQDADTGEIVEPGGVIVLDEQDVRALGLVAAGAIELEADRPSGEETKMPCPLCVEQGKKRPATFADADELGRHYADRHPGFRVPLFEKGGERS